MRAAVIDGRHSGWVAELPRPAIEPYEALVRIRSCGFCNGTDLKLWHGGVGFAEVAYPTVLGHETAGEVVELGSRVRSYELGDRVVNPTPRIDPGSGIGTAFGGMSEYGVAIDTAAMVEDGLDPAGALPAQRVPREMSFHDAAMLHTLKEAYSSLTNFGFAAGMNVLVYGDGPVGQALAAFARLRGAGSVVVAGHHADRLARITEVAAPDAAVDPREVDLPALLGANQVDLAIDAVGSVDIVYEAASLLRPGGTVGLYGVLPAERASLDLFALPTNVGVHVLMLPYGMREAHGEVLALVRAGDVRPSDYYSAVAPLADIDDIARRTAARDEFKIMVEI